MKPIYCKVLSWARICKPLKEPRNRFPACRACTTTVFDVTARDYIGWRNRFLAIDSCSLNVYKFWLWQNNNERVEERCRWLNMNLDQITHSMCTGAAHPTYLHKIEIHDRLIVCYKFPSKISMVEKRTIYWLYRHEDRTPFKERQ